MEDLEIKLLKDTILALREELEKVRLDEREHIQQAVVAATTENRQLRTSIIELRGMLELKEAQHEEQVQGMELQHDHEKAELHRTIAALRQKLEELNESNKKTRSSPEATAARTSHSPFAGGFEPN